MSHLLLNTERTTLFTMGHTAAIFLSDNSLERAPCREDLDERYPSMNKFYTTWQETQTH